MATPSNCYNLRYIGYSSINKFIPGLAVLQKPLHELYVSYLTPKGPRMPITSRLALTDRGIILTANGKDSFYSMRDILLWEPVQWVYVQTKDKKIMSAFEPMNPDHHLSQEGLFSKLDSHYKYLPQLKHEPILAIALKKNSDSKQIEVHAFVCNNDAHVFEVTKSLWLAEQVFMGQEAKGIGSVNSPPGQIKEHPKSVRGSSAALNLVQIPNGGEAVDKRGKQSARQAKGRKVEGEITLEELIRLADRALADPPPIGVTKDPPFKMGESWSAKEDKGVQRSRTFNDGPIVRETGSEENRRGAQEGRRRSPSPTARRVESNNNQPQAIPYYENVVPPKSGQPRTYENAPTPEVFAGNHQQFPVPADERRNNQNVDPRRKSVPHESLRAVIADSKLSKVSHRGSVLPGTDFSEAINHLGDSNPSREIVEVYSAHDEMSVPNASAKPIALVQPRKVPRYKVLPEGASDAVLLHKVSQNPDKGLDEPRKEQYQMGPGGNARDYTRSMYELNNIVSKPTTPQVQRKGTNHDSEPSKKITNSEMNLARKSSNPELDPVKKTSVPESSNRDGRENKAGENKKPERGRKDAEIEAFALNVNFERPPVNTVSPHGTNFENALGYFP